MKRNVLIVLAILGLSVFGMYKMHVKQTNISDILLEDIEVMADGESNNGRINNAMESRFQCGAPINGSACTTNVISCPGGGVGCTPRKCPYHG